MQSVHVSVLLHEVVEYLVGCRLPSVDRKQFEGGMSQQPENDEKPLPWYVDGTIGGAGHTLAIAKALRGRLNVIGLDRDKEAIERARQTLAGSSEQIVAGKVILECENFRNLDKVLDKHGINGVDMILLDLGISSDLLDSSGRGFTFQKDEPLFMTMEEPTSCPFTARDIVNDWEEVDIANVIFGYGEERFAKRIARAVINYREKKRIETSHELAELIKISVPAFYRRGKIHPATKTFQALRIAVNDELNSLREGLFKGFGRLNRGGRMAVISFHSLEDRIVKDFYKKQLSNNAKIITKKPIIPNDQEVAENPRSRSAKLRVIEK
jgi:16S rRNA (cytosine1402-N4)-methyltransferase